jgi:cell wall-associated NlpC family hydrolase
VAASDTQLSTFLTNAVDALGDPYVYGATGPAAFDCSGLVQWAAQKAGFKGVPRTSEAQWNWVQKISQAQLQPGDLVFSQWPGDNASPGPVQI